MARKKKPEDPPVGSPAWMATFSDMITQILAFFIMLFSFSAIDNAKFKQAIVSMQGAFGVLPSGNTLILDPLVETGTPGKEQEAKDGSLGTLQQEFNNALKEHQADQYVKVEPGSRRLTLRFDAALLFDSGRSEIKQEAISALDAIGQVLSGYRNPVLIEGHTDNDPMRPGNIQFPDNWMLSAGRAASVLRYLRDFHNIPTDQMTLAGYAEERPVAPNDTPEGKAKNRRVDIVVLER